MAAEKGDAGMANEREKSGRAGETIHRRFAREIIQHSIVLCLFALFYGVVWPLLARLLELHPAAEAIVSLSTQGGLVIYVLYQIPLTIALIWEDWKNG